MHKQSDDTAQGTPTLEEALNLAAAELPEGYTISIVVERDAGIVECCDENGRATSLDRPDDTLSEQVIAHLRHVQGLDLDSDMNL